MRSEASSQIVRRADINMVVAQLKKINVPHEHHQSPCAASQLREITLRLRLRMACHPKPKAEGGGEDGIRTHEKLLTSTPLAGERLRPLGHLSGEPLDKEKPSHNQPAGTLGHVKYKVLRKKGRRSGARSGQSLAGGERRRIRCRSPNRAGGRFVREGDCEPALMQPFCLFQTALVNRLLPEGLKSCHLCNRASG